jgi:hypothetical protein
MSDGRAPTTLPAQPKTHGIIKDPNLIALGNIFSRFWKADFPVETRWKQGTKGSSS